MTGRLAQLGLLVDPPTRSLLMWTVLPHSMVTSGQTAHIAAWSSKCECGSNEDRSRMALGPGLASHIAQLLDRSFG